MSVALVAIPAQADSWITESTAICLYESDFASNDCPEDLSGDGVVGTSDLLMLLSSYNMWCPE